MEVLTTGSTGTEVMEIQALLKKIGYDPGPIDGNFGNRTEQVVIQFQRNFNLTVDGIIGDETYRQMQSFLLGYDIYTVKPGDSVYIIARKYGTTINRILVANPGLQIYNLRIGQRITVPYGINVVDTNIDYTYGIMERDLQALKVRYPFLEIGIAGRSVLGRNLYYVRLGNGPNEVFYNGAHHGLEWITSVVLMKFIEDFSEAYVSNSYLAGYRVPELWNNSSIYVMPMVNPDGVDLVLNGLSTNNPYYQQLIQWNGGSSDFSKVWQANVRGVDLNHNYDASWELSKEAEVLYGITGPGPTRYSGPYPESEPESQGVANFTRNHNFRLVLAYHSQGEVIYWTYSDLTPPESAEIVEQFAEVSGYTPSQTHGIVSYPGYKDWFIKEYRRPGFTVEVGRGTNPLPIGEFDKIYKDNIGILLLAAII
ncbi:Gamma-D-glutamyl-L-diamino acid endopeptidase 1 [Clostridium sp. N3C]|uniref:M14 family metallopeptidase n=1 Tax=Clostridium sp. N3C TaxID=1776758 RepID=UPI00092E1A62|nr:M14 family metallopeptidase [Clostridium sp. N3C]SCN22749.1 Gamma-D-glutamyl-L-diamino acid endopeptidase 1 [Clostridium sp. N3C]